MAEILVVDDDLDIRETLRLVLEDAGHTVLEAPDGEHALSFLRTHPVGLVVLLDWCMPRLDGHAVLEALFAQPELAARHAILFCTAQSHPTLPLSLATLITALAVQVLTKPVDLDDLVAAVRAAEGRLAQRETHAPPAADTGQGGPPSA